MPEENPMTGAEIFNAVQMIQAGPVTFRIRAIDPTWDPKMILNPFLHEPGSNKHPPAPVINREDIMPGI
jgi:hypothetical protein